MPRSCTKLNWRVTYDFLNLQHVSLEALGWYTEIRGLRIIVAPALFIWLMQPSTRIFPLISKTKFLRCRPAFAWQFRQNEYEKYAKNRSEIIPEFTCWFWKMRRVSSSCPSAHSRSIWSSVRRKKYATISCFRCRVHLGSLRYSSVTYFGYLSTARTQLKTILPTPVHMAHPGACCRGFRPYRCAPLSNNHDSSQSVWFAYPHKITGTKACIIFPPILFGLSRIGIED